MAEQSLSLSTRCLSFDFIGTNPDESAEDVGTIQVNDREVIGHDYFVPIPSLRVFDTYETMCAND